MSIFYSLHDFLILEHKTSHFNAMLCNVLHCHFHCLEHTTSHWLKQVIWNNFGQFDNFWQFLTIFFFFSRRAIAVDSLGNSCNILTSLSVLLIHITISTMARMGAAILVASSPPSLSLYWTLLLCSIGGAGSATWSSASLPLATNSKWSEALLCRIQPIELDCKQPTALQSNDTHGTL